MSAPKPCSRSEDHDFGTAGGLVNVDCVLDNGSLSVEYDLGMGGTEGVSERGALLSNELSGLLDLARMLLRRGTLPRA